MKQMKIGILGCTIDHSNMGCMALTYSLINLLQDICKNQGKYVEFYIFSGGGKAKGIVKLAENINIDCEQLHVIPEITWEINGVYKTLRTIKKIPMFYKIYKVMKHCDFIIDMTQGDSFSDIYGKERFYNWTFSKRLVEKSRIPLILGPQTYGPFADSKVFRKAKKTIEDAQLVIARDSMSKDFVETFCNKQVIEGTDLAFRLPYNKNSKREHNKIKVGINPSGLLCKKKTDDSKFSIPLKTNFDEYLRQIIEWLKHNEQYEIHLISHVGNEAQECFGKINGVIYHSEFSNPIEAKNCIAEMDVFIGARMHATIAAFSSGVATIPVASSRKFIGLYRGIGYDSFVDLCEMSTEDSIDTTIEYIQNRELLQIQAKNSLKAVNSKYNVMKKQIADFIDEVIL